MDKRPLRVIFFIFLFFLLSRFQLWAQDPQAAGPVPAVSADPGTAQGTDAPSQAPALPSSRETGTLQPVQIDGDSVEFLQAENKVVIDGHVSIVKGTTTLRADHIEYHQTEKLAFAKGHVVLLSPQGEIRGEELKFNFESMTGDLQDAAVVTKPFYSQSVSISKVGENKIEMARGYITTCDLKKPHYKMYMKKLTMVPGDKIEAQSVRMVVGKVPLFYVSSMTQVISDEKPRVLYTPGYDKDWGAFLLSSWRYYFSDNLKGTVHLDYREKKDFASGLDASYKIPGFGAGLIKTYYMNERKLADHAWKERTTPTIERERFKAEWRHKWQIDQSSQIVSKYYKLSDNTFLKDYFEREYDRDQDPDTFFLFTKNFNVGTFSLRADKRVNRFSSSVERLPELGYNVSNQQIAGSNFYLENSTLFSSLSYPDASPTEVRRDNTRFDLANRISYPTKVGIFEFTPYVGERGTFYTQTLAGGRANIVRTIFDTGAAVSTKFYRVFDVAVDRWGMKIDKLRHIINPKVEYQYVHEPSFPADSLDLFDSTIDKIVRGHKVNFSLENRFQTKRNGQNVDLLRAIAETDFLLKEDQTNDGTSTLNSKGGFHTVTSDIEFRPVDWMSFHSDTDYSAHDSRWTSANFDIYVNHGKKWTLGFGKRYHVDVDDQITAQFAYVINPKWRFKVYERFDVGGEGQKEQEYTITRDLHCWEMDLSFNESRDDGSEIWMVFRLKAFPGQELDIFSTNFNKKKTGSLSLGE